MVDGRAELQRIILQYEKQRAEAIRTKQEAEVVLPFVRAALEELDAAMGNSEDKSRMERVHSQVESARGPQAVKPDPTPSSAPAAAKPVASPFGNEDILQGNRTASIASLLDEGTAKVS